MLGKQAPGMRVPARAGVPLPAAQANFAARVMREVAEPVPQTAQ